MKRINESIKHYYWSNTELRCLSYFIFPRSYALSNLNVMLNDLSNKKNIDGNNYDHLTNAMNWLYLSYERGKPGSAGYYNMNIGWSAPYPETTGYIIETFFDFIQYMKNTNNDYPIDDKYYNSAINMASWLTTIQLESGAFPGGLYNKNNIEPNVFNTGQIMIGLIRAYLETKNEIFLESAIKSGNWLIDIQDHDGSWRKHTYEKNARSYHSRVSWPLLMLYQVTNNEKYKESAIRNIEWILKNQTDEYWFENSNFFDTTTTLTHTLAYTLDGLLESAVILHDEGYVNCVKNTSEKILKLYEIRKYELLPALFDKNWNSKTNYSCVTGCAQMSIIWSKLYLITKDIRFFNAALKINSALKKIQISQHSDSPINGAIKGSHPIYGAYMPFSFPNWAAKFFIDALILEEKILSTLKTRELL